MLTARIQLRCRVLTFFLAAAVLLLAAGLTAGIAGDAAPEHLKTGEKRQKVVLLPFKNLAAIYSSSRNIRSPINGRFFLSGPVEERAAGFLDLNLEMLLLEKDVYTLVTVERSRYLMETLAGSQQPPLSERDLWAAVGRALGADAVLGGFIYRFRDRTGRDYGVDEAASVAFDLHLVRVSDGRLQWSGRVDETQQPLSDNLFNIKKFISRRGKWVTAQAMALEGLKSLIAEMLDKQL